jgi:hypothetical protein
MKAARQLLAVGAVVVTAVAVGCGSSGSETQSIRPGTSVDEACYGGGLHTPAGGWSLSPAIPAPASQPSVRHPRDCRYSVTALTGSDVDMVAALDPAGCYGMDEAGHSIVRRSDFCP